MPKFTAGVIQFEKEVFPQKRALFERLSHGQHPEALFITCSDSRIETAMITQSEPGELFICRNPGNIVPPHTDRSSGVTAAIELAVSVLKVPHVVICGHTGCSAMQAAIDPDQFNELDHIKPWLYNARAAVEVTNELARDFTTEQRSIVMTEQNVILQLQHLKTHPAVAAQLTTGEIELHGWIYDIKNGTVNAFDKKQNAFIPVAEFYA